MYSNILHMKRGGKVIGDNLKKARKSKQLSQREVADYLNISRQSVSKWETNQNYPDFDNLVLLSKLYEVSIDQLLKDTVIDIELNKSGSDYNNEWILLIILCCILSMAVPLGLLAPLIIIRNRQNTTYHKLINFIAILSFLINVYCIALTIGDYYHYNQEIEITRDFE